MVCDGAKASCAAKIAIALETGFLCLQMAEEKISFHPGEGLVAETTDRTIARYGIMGRDGMHETDKQILKMMITGESDQLL